MRHHQHAIRRFLTTIASHGFWMATAAEPAAGGWATADNPRKAVDWASGEQARGSPLQARSHSIAWRHGPSCGGPSIELGADPRVDTTAFQLAQGTTSLDPKRCTVQCR
jgi:hypothetical protein